MASRGPGLLGLCSSDPAGCAAVVNASTQRLLYAKEVSDNGWIGSWASIAFETSQSDPLIVMPYDVARPISIDVCTFPVPVRNQFWEYLTFGFGRLPKSACATDRCAQLASYDRGTFPTWSDVVPSDKKVRVRLTDPGDVGKRVLLQTLDANGQVVFSLDGVVQVTGEFLELTAPFVDSNDVVSKVIGVQKDLTLGPVSFYELDTVALTERLILTMQPGETTGSYRRYYMSGLPASCCSTPTVTPGVVQLTALCQLTYVPVRVVTDWLIIPNVEALINESQSMRYDGIDEPAAKAMALGHHRSAIRLLNGQSIHEQGSESPAISFAPFGSARLSRARVGSLI